MSIQYKFGTAIVCLVAYVSRPNQGDAVRYTMYNTCCTQNNGISCDFDDLTHIYIFIVMWVYLSSHPDYIYIYL